MHLQTVGFSTIVKYANGVIMYIIWPKFTVSPFNKQSIFKDDQYLLGKTNINSNVFDSILFARRDIKEISIPANITNICTGAFYKCYNLRKVEIPENSNLQIIGAFSSC